MPGWHIYYHRLGDALDVVSQHLTVTLGASLSQSLASFATSSHAAADQ